MNCFLQLRAYANIIGAQKGHFRGLDMEYLTVRETARAVCHPEREHQGIDRALVPQGQATRAQVATMLQRFIWQQEKD